MEASSELYGAAESQRFDHDMTTVRRESSDSAQVQCGSIAAVIGPEKRKRGRPPRGSAPARPPPPQKKTEEEEEDVCFICFDGGSLVLCDRKGCPKAYHPACIKRDESFFSAKVKWNCGWHICSVCRKASHFMCYTCTYSLCKGCIRNADYFSVRGNKGFCSTCKKMIMLIENKDEANTEKVQVDFDDKTSWEYLFKVYWIYLKGKLSLTLNELIQAKNPWKEAVAAQNKLQLANAHLYANDSKGAITKSSEHIELKNCKGMDETTKKYYLSSENQSIDQSDDAGIAISNEQLRPLNPDQSSDKDKSGFANGSVMKGYTEWATKELLEFVAHMRNGDTSALSQFAVQELLLDYIKRNNLRDPHKKSQIICDLRLKNLFGKPRLGHIEMLKLIEFHFLIKEDTQKNAFIPAAIVANISKHLETDERSINSPLVNKNKKRKTCKKGEDKPPQISLDEFAAIDGHNINLIYLRRSLMENLIEDAQKFQNDVVGSIVRIKIPCNDQKQDMYRLVHVVGTSKVPTPYKIGEKTIDIMLEVLNLDRKEAVSIDTLSNQEFTEDECRRLRQSIKCGLVKRMTVGEIQRKAMDLRPVKLNESLESEILRLNHLRDRASENGRKKEECIEKLQRLKTPEERHRRMLEIPEVHADPKMNPSYESEEDAGGSDGKKRDQNVRQRNPMFNNSGGQEITPVKRAKVEGAVIALMAQQKPDVKSDTSAVYNLGKRGNQTSASRSVTNHQVDRALVRCGSETSVASLSTRNSAPPDDSETLKLWHYRDPSGNIQGPFSIMQLRRWNKTGLFPPDMRVWTDDEHHTSVLLTDALCGLFHKASQILDNTALDGRGHVGWLGNSGGTVRESEGYHSDDRVRSNAARRDGFKSLSSLQQMNLLKGNNLYSENSQDCSNYYSDRQIHVGLSEQERRQSRDGQIHMGFSEQERRHEGGGLHIGIGQGNQRSSGNTMSQPTDTTDHERQSNGQSFMSQSSDKNMDSGTHHFVSVAKSSDSPEQNGRIDLSEFPSPTPKNKYESWEVQAAKELLSLSSDFPYKRSDIQDKLSPDVQDKPSPDIQDKPSPPPKAISEHQHEQITETQEQWPSNIAVQDSGRCPEPNPVVNGPQLPEVVEWGGGNSPALKPSVDDWDPGILPASLKPPEVLGDQVATPASNGDQLTYSSPQSNVIEFSTLAEESVSDLLAEVDAMESQAQGGLGSPTSAMRCSVELMPWSKSDCFDSIEEMSPAPDPAKSDAYSFTGDLQLPCQSIVTNELIRLGLIDSFDHSRRHDGHSSTSSEGETNSTDVSFNQGDAGSEFHPSVPCTVSQSTIVSAIDQSRGSENAIVSSMGQDKGSENTIISAMGQSRGSENTVISSMGQINGSENTLISAVGQSRASESTIVSAVGQSKGSDNTVISSMGQSRGSENTIISSLGQSKGSENTIISAVGQSRASESTIVSAVGQSKGSDNTIISSMGQSKGSENTIISAVGQSRASESTIVSAVGQSKGSDNTIISSLGQSKGSENTIISAVGQSRASESTIVSAVGQSKGSDNTIISSMGQSKGSENTIISAVGQSRRSENTVVSSTGQSKGSENTIASAMGQSKGSENTIGSAMGQSKGSENTIVSSMGQSRGSENTTVSAMSQSRGSESMVTGWGTTQRNANYGEYANPGYSSSNSRPASRNPNMNRGNENPAWDNQRRYPAERYPGPRDWAFQGGHSGHGSRGRPTWNRQSFSGGGGGYSRPPPRSHRVCKFYESGRCKKGASCDYLHP